MSVLSDIKNVFKKTSNQAKDVFGDVSDGTRKILSGVFGKDDYTGKSFIQRGAQTIQTKGQNLSPNTQKLLDSIQSAPSQKKSFLTALDEIPDLSPESKRILTQIKAFEPKSTAAKIGELAIKPLEPVKEAFDFAVSPLKQVADSATKIRESGESFLAKTEQAAKDPGLNDSGGLEGVVDAVTRFGIRGGGGIIGTPMQMLGSGLEAYNEGKKVQPIVEIGLGLGGLTPAGALFNAVFNQPAVAPIAEAVSSKMTEYSTRTKSFIGLDEQKHPEIAYTIDTAFQFIPYILAGGAIKKAGGKITKASIFDKMKDPKQMEGTTSFINRTLKEVEKSGDASRLEKVMDPETVKEVKEALDIPDFSPEEYLKKYSKDVKEAESAPTVLDRVKSAPSELAKALVDTQSDVISRSNEYQRKYKFQILPEKNYNNLVDMVYKAPEAAQVFMNEKGLSKLVQGLGKTKEVQAFGKYVTDKFATSEARAEIKTGIDLTEAKKFVESQKEKFEPFAQEFYKYNQALLDYATETGLVSKEIANSLKKEFPEYVPMERVFSELEQTKLKGTGSGPGSISTQSFLRKIKGSERVIKNPVEAVVERTQKLFTEGRRNQAAQSLASYSKLPGFEEFIRKMDPNEKIGAKSTISYLENGKKVTYEVPSWMEEAAKHLTVEQLNLIEKIARFPLRIGRLGITGANLAFGFTNPIKDIPSAFVNMPSGKFGGASLRYLNPLGWAKSAFDTVGKTDVFNEALKNAGISTSLDLVRGQPKATVKNILKNKNVGTKALYKLRPDNLLTTIEDVINVPEVVTRIQVYKATKNYWKAKGVPEERAIAFAAEASRNATPNYARHGSAGKVLNSIFIYFNAGIQGSRSFLKAVKERPLQTALKFGLAYQLPVMLATLHNLSDPLRRQAYEDIPEYEKENNLIILPDVPTQGEDGRWNTLATIPLQPGISSLAQPLRRILEEVNKIDETSIWEIANDLLETVSPYTPQNIASQTPYVIKTPLEIYTNKNFFTGIPIISTYDLDLPEYLQEKMSNPSAFLGKVSRLLKEQFDIDMSPGKVQYFIEGYLGGSGKDLVEALDAIGGATGISPKEEYTSPIDRLIKKLGSVSGGKIEIDLNDALDESLTLQAEEKVLTDEGVQKAIEELRNASTDQERMEIIRGLSEDVGKKLVETLKEDPTSITGVEPTGNKSLDSIYSRLSSLNVSNGARAEFIYEYLLLPAETDEERAGIMAELIEKKLISETVGKQLIEIFKEEGGF